MNRRRPSRQETEFRAACVRMNTPEDLRQALRGGVDMQDCREWGLGTEEWEHAIQSALAELQEDQS